MNGDHPFPGVLVTAYHGYNGASLKQCIVYTRIDAFCMVSLCFACKRRDFRCIVGNPLRVPPVIHIGFAFKKCLLGFCLVHVDQGFINAFNAGFTHHLPHQFGIVQKIFFEVIDAFEAGLVDHFLDRAVVFFLYAKWHLREQGMVSFLAFLQSINCDSVTGNVLDHAKTRHQLFFVIEHALLIFTQVSDFP